MMLISSGSHSLPAKAAEATVIDGPEATLMIDGSHAPEVGRQAEILRITTGNWNWELETEWPATLK